jgi:hypothetical protein
MQNVIIPSDDMLSVIMVNVIMDNAIMLNCIMLSIIMLNVIMLNVIMLNVIMLNVIMQNVVMLSAVMLSVLRLNVVAPPAHHLGKELLLFPRDTGTGIQARRCSQGRFRHGDKGWCCRPAFRTGTPCTQGGSCRTKT